eukprot:Platyproteum_vivax@DN4202_c0_g1_i1.p1
MNCLYLRNLSPQVTEDVLRETFKTCDTGVQKVEFKTFPSGVGTYAMLEFASSKGVTEAVQYNGTNLKDIPMALTVLDPAETVGNRIVVPGYANEPHSGIIQINTPTQSLSVEQLAQIQEVANATLATNSTTKPGEPESRQILRTVYICSMSPQVNEADLKGLFGVVGHLLDVRVEPSPHSSKKKIGFLEFEFAEEAQEALKFSNMMLKGDRIIVEPSKATVRPRVPSNVVYGEVPGLPAVPVAYQQLHTLKIKAAMEQVKKATMRLARKAAIEANSDSSRSLSNDRHRRHRRRRSRSRSEEQRNGRYSSSERDRRRDDRRRRSSSRKASKDRKKRDRSSDRRRRRRDDESSSSRKNDKKKEHAGGSSKSSSD